jgi:hypothetical protein
MPMMTPEQIAQLAQAYGTTPEALSQAYGITPGDPTPVDNSTLMGNPAYAGLAGSKAPSPSTGSTVAPSNGAPAPSIQDALRGNPAYAGLAGSQAPDPSTGSTIAPPAPSNGAPAPSNGAPAHDWGSIAAAYGLGAPPAEGMPATLPGVTVGTPPQMGTTMGSFDATTAAGQKQLQDIYGYSTPQMSTATIDSSQLPGMKPAQMDISPELAHQLSGTGYDPATLARMRAQAVEGPANAGIQQLMQIKRVLGANGINGGAAAAVQGSVARDVGQQQGSNLNQVELANANQGNQNQQFGIGQQTQIGVSNMQQANNMALAQAAQLFQSLRDNMNATNATSLFNTTNQVNQKTQAAGTEAGFTTQQAQQREANQHSNEQTNNANNWQAQQQQTQYDWNKQAMPWQELNNRYNSANSVLGNWGNAG